MPQYKIHDTPVAHILMATSSSTTFGGPPSPLEKAIRKTAIYLPQVPVLLSIFFIMKIKNKFFQKNSLQMIFFVI
jgi:hypothetical protein